MNSSDITLQRATAEDANYLCSLVETTMRFYIEESLGDWCASQARRAIHTYLDAGNFSLIYFDGQRAGAISVGAYPDYIQLEQIYIEPNFQGKGVGSYLVSQLIGQAKEGSKPLRLRVLKSNPARKLYERLGFEVMDESDARYFMECQYR